MAFYVRSGDVRRTPTEAGLSRAWEGLPQTFELSLHGATGGGKGGGGHCFAPERKKSMFKSLCLRD